MGQFFLLCVSLFSKNVYEDHNFYTKKKISPDICTIEEKQRVIEKRFRSQENSFKNSVTWAKYHLEIRHAGKNAKDNKKKLFWL